MPVNFYRYKFVVTGGGTGGHIMPLLAIKQFLMEYQTDLLYIGEQGGREEILAKQAGMKFKGIMAGKWRRYYTVESVLNNIIDVLKNVVGFWQALGTLATFRPKGVFAKGGYVSLPVIMAAWVLNIPILIHESDIVMGVTNRLALNFVKTIATGFPLEVYDLKKIKQGGIRVVYSGIPLENEFFESHVKDGDYKFFHFRKDIPILLITGGIQGAYIINEAIKEVLERLLKKWQVVHLAGERDYHMLLQMKEKVDLKNHYALFPTLGMERASAMRIADIIITRGSATTLAEITMMAKPAIIIPLPSAAGNHQVKNAEWYEHRKAVQILSEKDLSGEKLMQVVEDLYDRKEKREEMAKAMGSLAKVEAGRLITEELLKLARR